jgi:DNA-binding transcriptional MerR regulator
MNDAREGLLSIGNFAGLTRLSLKALRLYAQLGLLNPAYVDPATGYRYYSAAQVRPARLIRLLREMDMPLTTVRQVVGAAPADADVLVQQYLAGLEAQLAQARRVAHDVSAFIHGEVQPMPFDVTVRAVPTQPVLSLAAHLKVDRLIGFINESVDQLTAAAAAQGVPPAGAPFGLYHGPINAEDDGPIEVCLPLAQPGRAEGAIAARELAGGQAAVAQLAGAQCDFPAVLGAYDAVYEWIAQNGYQPDGSPREVWLSRPGEPERMEVLWFFQAPATDR